MSQELELLRQEATQTVDQGMSVMRHAITGAVAVVGAGLAIDNANSPLIVLLSLILLEIAALYVFSRSRGIFNLAAYIREFHKVDFPWESRLKAFQEIDKRPFYASGKAHMALHYSMFFVVGLIASLIAYFLARDSSENVGLCLIAPIGWSSLWLVQLVAFYWINHRYLILVERLWKQVHKSETD